ncbi:MAG: prolyl aminopeptidase [Alphaproteobacteria bacterium]|nr:prolyl aminopeptidase [Alphaproteobacteria bacterium]MBU0859402.1 prolyl aminopeptidase [Alphaproteobacteria bacterium]
MSSTRKLSSAFYPESTPYNKGFLRLDDTHEMYFAEYGNPKGIPVVYLHGGPGGGSSPVMHRFFDPKAFRIVIYDQRGAGQSRPFGNIKDNSPDILVADMETLRTHLKIDKWHVAGGSWGSTLALLYAQSHPDKALSLTLRGIFLMRQAELDHLYVNGATVFPEEFARLKKFIPAAEQNDLLRAYYNRIIAGDKDAARAWTRFENAISRLHPRTPKDLDSDTDTHAIGMATMETHFFINHRFTPDDRLLRNAHKIQHIPTVIVQGRYDSVCAPVNAWELHKALTGSHLQMVIAGHSAMDHEIAKALVKSADNIRDHGTPLPQTGNKGPSPRVK